MGCLLLDFFRRVVCLLGKLMILGLGGGGVACHLNLLPLVDIVGSGLVFNYRDKFDAFLVYK